jgi:secreted PhoX family phosphatase
VIPTEPTTTFEDVVRRRLSRRDLFRVGVVVGGGAVVAGAAGTASARPGHGGGPGGGVPGRHAFDLATWTAAQPTAPAPFDSPVVAGGFTHDVVIRWGDPLRPGRAPFDVTALTAAEQAERFGFNADYTAYFPRRRGDTGPRAGTEGLLWVNHEYTDPVMMLPGYVEGSPTREQVDIELAAHGGSLVRVRQERDGTWRYEPHRDNARITATTPMQLTGPVAGHPLLRTSADPAGTQVLGMLNNCGGGVTPWGTLLTCEENIDQYFANRSVVTDARQQASLTRFGVPEAGSERRWEDHHARFDLAQEPNEVNRFGWVVEIDPYDPRATPRKRTALGRFKHEAAAGTTTADGRYAVYSGDDSRFEHVFKFVTRDRVSPSARRNRDLLDAGTLYAARFDDDGSGVWLPLVHGEGPLTPENGWADQAEVLLYAREAASALGATPMDRPEDIEPNPVTGSVYVALTNNSRRTETDAANPRAGNATGHVVEIVETGSDAGATTFAWGILLLAGDATDGAVYGGFTPDQVSELACPDNLAVDSLGQLWIATDGAPSAFAGRPTAMNDAVLGLPVVGAGRGRTQQIFGAVYGAQMTGVFFNSTETTMFASVQHPGEGGTLAEPTSNWPDGGSSVPRSSVVAIRRG